MGQSSSERAVRTILLPRSFVDLVQGIGNVIDLRTLCSILFFNVIFLATVSIQLQVANDKP